MDSTIVKETIVKESHHNRLDALVKGSHHNRLDALLALRGFACLMVLVCHAVLAAPAASVRESINYQGYDLSWVLFSHPNVAVWIFFVLSGYLMGKAFYSQRYSADVSGTINFWRNRALRILPLYYFVVLIMSTLVYTDVLDISNWGFLIRVLTFTYNAFIGDKIIPFDGVMWSLSTELQFYILVPFIYSLLRPRLTNSWSVVAAGMISIFGTFLIKAAIWISLHSQIPAQEEFSFTIHGLKYWYTPLITNIDLFLCGFLVNPFLKYYNPTHKFPFLKLPIRWLAILLIIVLYLFSAYHAYYQQMYLSPNQPMGLITSTQFFILQPLTALVTAFFIFAFEANTYHDFTKNEKLSFSAILENPLRVVEIPGVLSYGVYLWHFPIMEKVTPLYITSLPLESFVLRLIATTILSVILSTVTYYLVEVPFVKWKQFER